MSLLSSLWNVWQTATEAENVQWVLTIILTYFQIYHLSYESQLNRSWLISIHHHKSLIHYFAMLKLGKHPQNNVRLFVGHLYYTAKTLLCEDYPLSIGHIACLTEEKRDRCGIINYFVLNIVLEMNLENYTNTGYVEIPCFTFRTCFSHHICYSINWENFQHTTDRMFCSHCDIFHWKYRLEWCWL